MDTTIGLDIGGTKIVGGVIDRSGKVLEKGRRETPAHDSGAVAQACAELVTGFRAKHDVTAVGVACAGLVDASRSVVLFAPNLAWRDEPLRNRLEAVIDVPVILENDANAAAWGEFTHGAAERADHMLLVTVGTGVGGGVVLGGSLLRGGFGVAAEIGHIRVVPKGLRCGCGKRGCLEVYASGSALLRDARERVRAGKADSIALSERCHGDPEKLKGTDITALAQAGDPTCLELLVDIGRWLGEGIASIDAVLNPEVVVIGGGVSAAGALLLAPVRESYLKNLVAKGYRPEPQVLLATLGDNAGLIGAAAQARDVAAQAREVVAPTRAVTEQVRRAGAAG